MTETARLAQLLASRLQAVWGAAAEITGIQRLPGGASRESWGVQARLADGAEHRLILLRDPGRSDRDRDVAVEAAAMVAARAAGVPVPEPARASACTAIFRTSTRSWVTTSRCC